MGICKRALNIDLGIWRVYLVIFKFMIDCVRARARVRACVCVRSCVHAYTAYDAQTDIRFVIISAIN